MTQDDRDKRTASVLGVIHAELEHTVVNEANCTKNNRDFSGGGLGLAITPGFILPLGYLEWYQMNLKYSDMKQVTRTETITTPAKYRTETRSVIDKPETPTLQDIDVPKSINGVNGLDYETIQSVQDAVLGDIKYIPQLKRLHARFKTLSTLDTAGLNKLCTEVKKILPTMPFDGRTDSMKRNMLVMVYGLSSGSQKSHTLAENPTITDVNAYLNGTKNLLEVSAKHLKINLDTLKNAMIFNE